MALALALIALVPAAAGAAVGDFDANFNAQVGGSPAWVSDAAAQTNGQVVIGGIFTSVGGTTRNRIARVDGRTGALDPAFNPNASDRVRAVAIQPDGKILIGGDFTSVGGTNRNRLARLNSDGTVDTGFNPDVDAPVYDIQIQSDGKLLIGGAFALVGGQSSNKVARLNADGTRDASFTQADSITGGPVLVVARQADGTVLAGGNIVTTIGSTTLYGLLRIGATGSIDTTFSVDLDPISPSQQTPNNLGHQVDAIALQADGKILMGGTFAFDESGVNRTWFLRLNADGTLDAGFTPNADGAVTAIVVQVDGTIVVGGLFTSVGGQGRRGIARVLATGAVDSTLADPNVNSRSNVIITQSDGGIVFGGNFGTVGGVSRPSLARLRGVSVPPTITSVTPGSGAVDGGTPITIEGSGFLDGATVTIGTTACTDVVVIDATKITCTTPSGTAGARSVTVTNPDSEVATLASAFTYSEPEPESTTTTIAATDANSSTTSPIVAETMLPAFTG